VGVCGISHNLTGEIFLHLCTVADLGRDSSVGIVTGYGLDGSGIESRWGGTRFSAPVQTGPGAHAASWTMGTRSFPGVKSARGVTLTPSSPSSAVVMTSKKKKKKGKGHHCTCTEVLYRPYGP
jgi:hypothetical protein